MRDWFGSLIKQIELRAGISLYCIDVGFDAPEDPIGQLIWDPR